jgi:hypothetical protein
VKRVLGFLFAIAGASCATAFGSPVTQDSTHAVKPAAKSDVPARAAAPKVKLLAPADEYFGPLKMSVLGMRNVIHDLTIRYEPTWDADHHLANSIMGTAVMTEASLHDWEKKYPGDDQLARTLYLLQHLYAKIETNDAQSKAKDCAKWLVSRYSRSWYAKNMRVMMNRPAPPASPSTSTTPATDSAAPAGVTAPGTSTTTTGTVPAGSTAPATTEDTKPAQIVPVPAPPASGAQPSAPLPSAPQPSVPQPVGSPSR